MRFTTTAAIVFLATGIVEAQKTKPVKVYAPPVTAAPAPAATNSAAQLAKMESQTAHLRTSRPVTHAVPVAKTAPDLGKNKPIRGSRSPQPAVHH